MESTLTVGPFSDSGYTFKSVVYDEDGGIEEVLPGQIADEYYKTITYEYMWSKEGLWEEECYTGQKLNKLNAFVNGTTAIYVVDPEITKLINVARQAKKANAGCRVSRSWSLCTAWMKTGIRRKSADI